MDMRLSALKRICLFYPQTMPTLAAWIPAIKHHYSRTHVMGVFIGISGGLMLYTLLACCSLTLIAIS